MQLIIKFQLNILSSIKTKKKQKLNRRNIDKAEIIKPRIIVDLAESDQRQPIFKNVRKFYKIWSRVVFKRTKIVSVDQFLQMMNESNLYLVGRRGDVVRIEGNAAMQAVSRVSGFCRALNRRFLFLLFLLGISTTSRMAETTLNRKSGLGGGEQAKPSREEDSALLVCTYREKFRDCRLGEGGVRVGEGPWPSAPSPEMTIISRGSRCVSGGSEGRLWRGGGRRRRIGWSACGRTNTTTATPRARLCSRLRGRSSTCFMPRL